VAWVARGGGGGALTSVLTELGTSQDLVRILQALLILLLLVIFLWEWQSAGREAEYLEL
jgi:ATP/ADP translocase